MIKRIFIAFILILICFGQVLAQENINSYDYIKVQITNDLEFGVNNWQKDVNVGWFYLYSYFLPQTIEGAQYLNSFNTTHSNYQLINGIDTKYLQFEYDENTLKDVNKIQNNFILESFVTRPKIKTKEYYPIDIKVQKKYTTYLEFSGLIDIDNDIRTQASTIAQGEDDVYIVASKVAKWLIEDIEYDLSTVTANPNQKSTQVFQSKAGVCKEITNLFVSMMRSLGIPARVVSGYAYTTSDEVVNYVGSNWGGHAWAEVLIAGQWVPFDLTYDQYGFVDATHIITDRHHELRARSASINASGYGFNLVTNSLKTGNEFKIVDYRENVFDHGFEIDVKGPNKLGFDSYGYVQVDIKNTKDFYQLLFLRIAKTKETELLDNEEKMTIFEPNEEKTIYFRYKIPQLKSGFRYTFPFTIYNEFISEQFEVSVDNSYSKIKEIGLPREKIENKTLSENNLNFDCNYIINSPLNTILCSVKNPNNYEISNLQLCISSGCQEIDLKLNEIKSFTFNTNSFSETLTYYYGKERGQFELNIQKPELIISYVNISNNNFEFEYKIDNYLEDLKLDIDYNNSIKSYDVLEYSTIKVPIEYGNTTMIINLLLNDATLSSYTKNIDNPKPKLSFIDKILNWILELITF